jgi:hypothetical protein
MSARVVRVSKTAAERCYPPLSGVSRPRPGTTGPGECGGQSGGPLHVPSKFSRYVHTFMTGAGDGGRVACEVLDPPELVPHADKTSGPRRTNFQAIPRTMRR